MENNISEERMNHLITTWQKCYLVTLRTLKARKNRLNELLTWDKPRKDNEIEHTAKVKALENLIGNYITD